jgi:hypothetical protein
VNRGRRARGGTTLRVRTSPKEFRDALVECWLQADEDGFLARSPIQRIVLDALYVQAIDFDSIHILATGAWLESATRVPRRRASEAIGRLEAKGWLRKIPLKELRHRYPGLYQKVKRIQLQNVGGRPPTVVELRNDPSRKTAWMRA